MGTGVILERTPRPPRPPSPPSRRPSPSPLALRGSASAARSSSRTPPIRSPARARSSRASRTQTRSDARPRAESRSSLAASRPLRVEELSIQSEVGVEFKGVSRS
eukprot:31155-Pelagococcus_subviridis.AAC.9